MVYSPRKVGLEMNSEPGMGFLPTVSSPKKRIAPDVVPNATPVVNNFNFSVDPKAAEAVRDALFMALMLVFAVILLKYGPKLLRA